MPSWHSRARALFCALVPFVLGACAAAGSDLHLAPFYTRISTADGGTLVEAAGGLYRQHRRDEGAFLAWRTLAPFYGIDRQRNGDYTLDHPFLFGRTKHSAGETVSYTVPLYLGWKKDTDEGEPNSLVLTLPGLLYQHDKGGTHWGWFPFYGHFEDVLTFDQATFVLWPLYIFNDRSGRRSHHVLWPFFGWTTGAGEASWHIFPLIARAKWEGRYDRTYFLWPFFHWQKNHLGGGEEEPETNWMFFPFLGKSSRGSYEAYTALWPALGYSHDSRSGFWALDFPFPFVRIQRGGPDETVRTRFWPFYSHLDSAGLKTTSWLWPLHHSRHEENSLMERDSAYFVPFWQTWDKLDKATGERSSWRKVWPLYRLERRGDWKSFALLDLDPFFRNDLISRGFTGFFRLWESEEEPAFRRERSFLGLYRRERGRGEDRRSLAGLWASRSYQEDGAEVKETSLLFGLLRWRVTAEHGFDMLPAAFPGPGWPQFAAPSPAAASRTYF